MGTHAVIAIGNLGVYIHYDGTRGTVLAYTNIARERHYRALDEAYGIARLTGLVCEVLSNSETGVGVIAVADDDTNASLGVQTFVRVDKNWDIGFTKEDLSEGEMEDYNFVYRTLLIGGDHWSDRTSQPASPDASQRAPARIWRYECPVPFLRMLINPQNPIIIRQKVARQRDHSMHQMTNYLIKKYQSIFVGDVSDAFLRSGNFAKTAYDSSFYKFKEMLKYKASGTGRQFFLIDEKFTTQACSACGSLCGPQSTGGLVVREWQCNKCGTLHDRDVNAAINICHLGMKQHPPCAGTSRAKIDPPSQQPSRCEAGTGSIAGQA